MLLVGPAEGAPAVQAWDPASGAWSTVVAGGPVEKGGFYPYYQTAYDPGSKTVFCLSGGPVLYALRLEPSISGGKPPAEHPATTLRPGNAHETTSLSKRIRRRKLAQCHLLLIAAYLHAETQGHAGPAGVPGPHTSTWPPIVIPSPCALDKLTNLAEDEILTSASPSSRG
jgi:hypothetical protein